MASLTSELVVKCNLYVTRQISGKKFENVNASNT